MLLMGTLWCPLTQPYIYSDEWVLTPRGNFYLCSCERTHKRIKWTHSSRTSKQDGKYYMWNPIWKKERDQPGCKTGWIEYIYWEKRETTSFVCGITTKMYALPLHLNKIEIFITFFLRERESGIEKNLFSKSHMR